MQKEYFNEKWLDFYIRTRENKGRNEFGGGYHDGRYQDLRSVTEKAEGKEYSSFYLVAEEAISHRVIKQMIRLEDGYDIKKLTEVYCMDYGLEENE